MFDLEKLSGIPLKAMLWHLNEAVRGPWIDEKNMFGCTEEAVKEALFLLKDESPEVYGETIKQLGVKDDDYTNNTSDN